MGWALLLIAAVSCVNVLSVRSCGVQWRIDYSFGRLQPVVGVESFGRMHPSAGS